jgi:hypothetical protein
LSARFGDQLAFSSAKAPESNGCFEVSVALPDASPWPPPPVVAKDYSPAEGTTLLWSKFNGDRRLAGPEVEAQMAGIGNLIELLAAGREDEFADAAAAAAAARLEANKPLKKDDCSDAPSTGAIESLVEASSALDYEFLGLAPAAAPPQSDGGGPPSRRTVGRSE